MDSEQQPSELVIPEIVGMMQISGKIVCAYDRAGDAVYLDPDWEWNGQTLSQKGETWQISGSIVR